MRPWRSNGNLFEIEIKFNWLQSVWICWILKTKAKERWMRNNRTIRMERRIKIDFNLLKIQWKFESIRNYIQRGKFLFLLYSFLLLHFHSLFISFNHKSKLKNISWKLHIVITAAIKSYIIFSFHKITLSQLLK